MKLLKKSVVISEIANQRKQQIDEGIILASKIDALRQTLGNLEQQHSQFLLGVETELKLRTQGLNDEIAAKEREVQDLEEKRKILLLPLNEEWKKVESEKNQIELSKAVIAKGLLKISEKEKKSEEKYQNSKSVLARINIRERELAKVYSDTEEKNIAITEIYQTRLKEKKDFDEHLELKNKELISREMAIATKERENEIERNRLREESEIIIKTKAQLEDQRKTLERAINRIK